jgi:hypothetical protein
MLTETFIRQNEKWLTYLTGLTASEFWPLLAALAADFAAYEQDRLQRPTRRRTLVSRGRDECC